MVMEDILLLTHLIIRGDSSLTKNALILFLEAVKTMIVRITSIRWLIHERQRSEYTKPLKTIIRSKQSISWRLKQEPYNRRSLENISMDQIVNCQEIL